jgi:molecular chaperone GrpE
VANEESTDRHRDDENRQASAIDQALNEALDEVSTESQARHNAASDNETSPEATASQLRQELAEANKRGLMAQAELENFRKRTRREQSEQLKYSVMPIVRDLLPVIDNFERAMGAVPSDDANAGMIEGIRMVQKMLMDVLAEHGCHEIPVEGVPFDPMQHEAVGQMPSDSVPAGSVLKVMQTGYRLHDRVIRPSQVIVSQG